MTNLRPTQKKVSEFFEKGYVFMDWDNWHYFLKDGQLYYLEEDELMIRTSDYSHTEIAGFAASNWGDWEFSRLTIEGIERIGEYE